jgi:ribonuclease-3 family protein
MIKPFIAQDLREVSPLVLAYIGDSIYELYARCKSASLGAGSNNKMHNNTVRYVSAEAQANSIRILQDELTEKETDYFRRGKNSNPHAVSKNANHADYMYATGFEALLGYLFLNNEVRRFDIATLSLSESFRIAAQEEGMFYNMTIEPRTGDIYVTDAKNYMMNGTVYRYTNDGLLLSSFEAGVIPSAMLFK